MQRLKHIDYKFFMRNNYLNILYMDNYYTLISSTDPKHLEFVGNLTNIEPNDISILFFSDEALDIINDLIIKNVKEKTFEMYGKKLVIDKQNKDHLYIIMRFVYFKNANYTDVVENEVNMLIDKTVEMVLPTVINSLFSHLKYLEDMEKRFMPIIIPNPASSGNNRRELPPIL